MNRILREKFVELYQTPILENVCIFHFSFFFGISFDGNVFDYDYDYEQLLESFQESFPTLSFPPLPDRGDFDLSDVLESSYFFN